MNSSREKEILANKYLNNTHPKNKKEQIQSANTRTNCQILTKSYSLNYYYYNGSPSLLLKWFYQMGIKFLIIFLLFLQISV
jgi:hypothetical protein